MKGFGAKLGKLGSIYCIVGTEKMVLLRFQKRCETRCGTCIVLSKFIRQILQPAKTNNNIADNSLKNKPQSVLEIYRFQMAQQIN